MIKISVTEIITSDSPISQGSMRWHEDDKINSSLPCNIIITFTKQTQHFWTVHTLLAYIGTSLLCSGGWFGIWEYFYFPLVANGCILLWCHLEEGMFEDIMEIHYGNTLGTWNVLWFVFNRITHDKRVYWEYNDKMHFDVHILKCS